MRVGFGVNVNQSAAPGADPVTDALHAEALGFDAVTVSDHLTGGRPSFETWTLLTWIAARTERIGIGSNVLGLPYRSPAVTAKMAESLDRLSGGRLTLGLGGGGNDDEFRAFGVPVRTPREKVDALAEAVRVIRALWSEPEATVEGDHYRLEGATLEPKPERRIPIWLGTYGPRAVALTGREADGWTPSFPFAPPEQYRELRRRVRDAAAEAGRDPDELTYAYNVGVGVAEGAQPKSRAVVGGPEEVAERLAGFVRDGVTFVNVWPVGDPAEQRERIAKEIIPAVRDAGR